MKERELYTVLGTYSMTFGPSVYSNTVNTGVYGRKTEMISFILQLTAS